MSLIHNMLKDLEKRNSHARDAMPTRYSQAKAKQLKISQKNLLWIFIIFTLLVIALTWSQHKKPLNLMSTMLSNETKLSDIKPTPETAWIKPVGITGVTLQVKGNITEITFLLDHAALYQLLSHDVENQLTVIFDKANLLSELPPVNYLNTAILNLSTQNLSDNTEFKISLQPGAIVKYVNLNDSDKNPELTIAIEMQPNNSEIATTAQNGIKSQALQSLLSQQYQSALKIAEAGEYQTAIQQLSSLLKADPHYQEARISLAALLLDQGKLSQAELIVDQGLKSNTTNTSLIELKARILATQGKPKQALSVLQRFLPPIGDNPEYHALLAAMYEQTNEYQLAANLYKQLVDINSHNGNWWFGLGVSMDKLGQSKSAMEAYSHAMTEGQLQTSSIMYVQNRMHQLQEVIDDKE